MADKANDLPASPIIFKARGFVPDTRLNVFGTFFHVHSSVLKLYSHYFYTYLDAPGSPTAVPGTAFKYDWTTKVVDDGADWQLVSNNDKVRKVSEEKDGPNLPDSGDFVCPSDIEQPRTLSVAVANARTTGWGSESVPFAWRTRRARDTNKCIQ